MREDWVECSFGDLIENISTSKYKVKQKDYIKNGEYPVVDQGQNLIGGYYDNPENIIPVNLPVIIFGDHTKCLKYINFKFIPGADGTKILKVKNALVEKYIFYILKVLVFKIEDKGYARHFQFLQKEYIPLPPFPEQLAIVKKIETLFSSLDASISDLKKAQEQLKIYRQAVLKIAFEGEGEYYNICDITKDIFAGGDKPARFSENKNSEFSVPIYANAVANKGLYGYTDLARVNHVAVTIAGRGSGTGHVELREHPYLPIVRLINFIPKEEILDAKYLYYYLKGQNITGTGSAIPQLTIPTVKEYLVFVPSPQEQAQIVKQIETRLSVCDAVEKQIQESLTQVEALRLSILKKAFEGKLLSEEEVKACQQAPDYEPASVLLEKIRADKEASKSIKRKSVKK